MQYRPLAKTHNAHDKLTCPGRDKNPKSQQASGLRRIPQTARLLEPATNPSIHNVNTRNKHHFIRPNAELFCCQESTFHVGIQTFNSLPRCLRILKKEKAKFKVAVRKYLNTQPF